MPAVLSSSSQYDVLSLGKREWQNTVGQSGMTPTAFAFLVPVFVVVFFAPFLCVFCVRRRSRNTPIPPLVRKVKKPALRREEARERLKEFTDVVVDLSHDQDERVTDQPAREESSPAALTPPTTTTHPTTNIEPSTPLADTSSISELECAICLSALHAPSPPAPALLPTPNPSLSSTDPPPPLTPTSPEQILKLHSCSHAFHASCLVSWFVLRKTTCPICRAAYISTEDMKAYEEAEAAEMEMMVSSESESAGGVEAQQQQRGNASNWRYFWAGQSVRGREAGGEAVRRGEAEGGASGGRRWRVWRR